MPPRARDSRQAGRPTADLRAGSAASARRTGVLPFIAAIALSAFAMFSLELVAGRVVLPVFGGAPAVWATTLCFFTGVLFVGYLYAHTLISCVSTRRGVAIHLGVACFAVTAAFLAPAHVGSLRIAGLPDAFNVLLVLTVVAGAPGFLFSTTTPLISAWYARLRSANGSAGTGATDGAGTTAAAAAADAADRGPNRDAFWLYAASNGASFAAVLGYPFLVQPFVALSLQRSLIAVAALAFTGLLVAVGMRVRNAPTAAAARDTGGTTAAGGAAAIATDVAPTWRRQARWLAAAFVPAGLLSATTTYITTDLLSAPMLWVWPLALYLASFVVAFSATGRRMLPRLERLVPAAATLLWVPSLVFGSWPVFPLMLVVLSSFGILACAIHGRLAGDRPAERHLTRFYLILSAGGVLATAFVAIVAPLVFPDVYEYPILIVGSLTALALFGSGVDDVVWTRSRSIGPLMVRASLRVLPYAVLGLLFLALVLSLQSQVSIVAGLLAAGALVIVVARSYRTMAVISAIAIVALTFGLSEHPLFQQRTFFGVLQVQTADEGASLAEYSGTTLHGVQFQDVRRTIPTSYYVRSGPLGDVFDDLAKRAPSANIGVVGLGTGTIAAY